MKKLYILLGLLGSFVAFAMQQDDGKITVNSIINKTDKNWLFRTGLNLESQKWDTEVKISANQTVQVNQILSKQQHWLIPPAVLQLDPIPDKGLARFNIYIKNGEIDSGRQNKEGTWARVTNYQKVEPNINIIIRLETERGTGEYFVLDFEPASITAPSLLTLGAQKVAQIIQTGKLSLEEAKKKTPREVYERVLALIPADEIKKIQAKELQNKALELVALLMKNPANEAAVKTKIKGLDLETLIAINEILANQTAINRVQAILQEEIAEKVE